MESNSVTNRSKMYLFPSLLLCQILLSVGSSEVIEKLPSTSLLNFVASVNFDLENVISGNLTMPGRMRRSPESDFSGLGCLTGAAINVYDNGWSLSNIMKGCSSGVTLAKWLGGRKKRSIHPQIDECQLTILAFTESDKNNDGFLDFDEIGFGPNISELSARRFFDTRDLNQNGRLEPAEMGACLQNATISTKKRRKRCSSGGCSQTYYVPVYN